MKNAFEGNVLFLGCTISLNQKRNLISKEYRKPTHTCQHTHFSSSQALNVKLSTIKFSKKITSYLQ